MVTVSVLGWRQLMATSCERQKHLGLRRRVERVERVSMREALAILGNLRASKSGQASGRTALYRRGAAMPTSGTIVLIYGTCMTAGEYSRKL